MCLAIRPLRFSCIIWIGLFWLLPTCLAQAQTTMNVLKVNPLSIFVGTANVKMEHRLGDRFSGQIGVYVGAPRLRFETDSTVRYVKYFFVGIIPELRYYISFNHMPNPKGFFVASYCKYAYVWQRYAAHARTPTGLVHGGVVERNHVATVGFLIGYQHIFENKLSLEAYLGPQYSFLQSNPTFTCPSCSGQERPIDRPGLRFDGIDPRFGITLGYAF